MDAKVTWAKNLAFTGTADSGFKVPLDADSAVGGDGIGFKPLELMLVSLAGCTAMDTISILKKKGQQVEDFEVKVHGVRKEDHPRVFTQITIEYVVKGHNIDQAAVERAVELSAKRYCPAQAMLGQVVPIEQKITILPVD